MYIVLNMHLCVYVYTYDMYVCMHLYIYILVDACNLSVWYYSKLMYHTHILTYNAFIYALCTTVKQADLVLAGEQELEKVNT